MRELILRTLALAFFWTCVTGFAAFWLFALGMVLWRCSPWLVLLIPGLALFIWSAVYLHENYSVADLWYDWRNQ